MLVFANKQDIAGSLTSAEIAEVGSSCSLFASADPPAKQALQLSLLTSHTSTIQPCCARSAATEEPDKRIWVGLDWVVKEVGRRVYYGSGGGVLETKADEGEPGMREGTVVG